jgi:23S rRNA (cytosine1962-C5)-methyltransferase
LKEIQINRKAAQRLESGHPWIFASDLADPGGASGGDTVAVIDPSRRCRGIAHYSDSSQIALRMLSGDRAEFGPAQIAARIDAAQAYRERAVRDTDAYRLVHSEADLLPGLTIDRYGDCFTIQAQTQAMDRAVPSIVEALAARFAPRVIIARHDTPARRLERLPQEKTVLQGEWTGPAQITMNGLTLEADLLGGMKTGVFLDQRENYRAAMGYARGRALDCFASTGGFALHLARVCESVEAADASAGALETAARNAARNGITNAKFEQADVFDLLGGYAAARRKFDTVVLDPPAFAKSRNTVEKALGGYKDINLRALKLLGPGGVLITCSCSFHVSEAALLEVIAQAALDAGRTLRFLDRRQQAADHPVLLTVPETLYLKYFAFQVL